MIRLDNVDLPLDMLWQDEFAWTPVEQTRNYAIGGALVIQEAQKLAGRPITLFGGDRSCWVSRSTIEALHALASAPNSTYTLQYHDQTLTVAFDQSAPIESKMVMRVANPSPETKYTLTLKLIEV